MLIYVRYLSRLVAKWWYRKNGAARAKEAKRCGETKGGGVGDFPSDVDRVGEGKRDVMGCEFASVKTSRPARAVRGPYRAKDRKDDKEGFQKAESRTEAISVWYSMARHHTRFSFSTRQILNSPK